MKTSRTMKRLLLTTFIVTTLSLIAVSRAYPGIVLCALTSPPPQTTEQVALMYAATARIETLFGPMSAQPATTFFDTPDAYWPLQPNPHGSTSFIGDRTCLLIGPNGQNIDVAAHELMHAEIAARMGYWRRARHLPTWLDEGLAMQVDWRESYDLAPTQTAADMQPLSSAQTFFVADDKQLTWHYASAKVAARQWLEAIGSENLFLVLSDAEHAVWDSQAHLVH